MVKKLLLRGLPHDLPRAALAERLPPHAALVYYTAGKRRAGGTGEAVPGMACVAADREANLQAVGEALAAARFGPEPGAPAQVALAPSQTLPRRARGRDKLAGTIEGDSHYRAFVESLSAPPPALEPGGEDDDEEEGEEVPALLAFVVERARRERARQRQKQTVAAAARSAQRSREKLRAAAQPAKTKSKKPKSKKKKKA